MSFYTRNKPLFDRLDDAISCDNSEDQRATFDRIVAIAKAASGERDHTAEEYASIWIDKNDPSDYDTCGGCYESYEDDAKENGYDVLEKRSLTRW